MGRGVLLFVFVLLAGPARASWWASATPKATVVTDSSAEEARRLAHEAQRFDAVVDGVFPGLPPPAGPPVFVAFASRASLARYVPVSYGRPQPIDGVFHGGDRPYAALTLGASDAARSLAHEYVHMRLFPALAAQPPWVGEGLAEVLSAWALRTDGAPVAGLPAPEHLAVLLERGLVPLAELLAVGYASPAYHDAEDRRRLYASAWALTHFLVVGRPEGVPRLRAFLDGVAAGRDGPAAFASAFGLSLAAAEAELPGYLASPLPHLPVAADPAALAALGAPEAAPAAAAEVERHLGQLAARAGRLVEARKHLEAAVALDPGSVEAHEARVEAAVRSGRHAEAARLLADALRRAGPRPRLLLAEAQMIVEAAQRRGAAPSDEEERRAVALLEQALRGDPALADAADLVARLRPQPVSRRIAALAPAVARHPQRTELALNLAALHVRRNDGAAAARVLRRARDLARDETQRFLAAHMLGRLEAIAATTREARATLVRVECLADGALRLHLVSTGRPFRLGAASASSFFIYDQEGETRETSLVCGAQSAPVRVAWQPGGDGGEGRVLWMSFGR